MNNNNLQLISFNAICDFIRDLNIAFKFRPIKLYEYLLDKTTFTHKDIIAKHIDLFREFCITNRDGIFKKDYTLFISNKIEYSPKVFIDFTQIFTNADTETTNSIWNHILTISALVDKEGKAKEILKNSKTNEADFLSNIISKIENNVKIDPANPLQAMGSILNSGIVNDVVSDVDKGLKNGDLDLGKLLGTVQQLISPGGATDDGQANPMNLLNNLGAEGSNQGGMDLSGILNMMGPMLSSLNMNSGDNLGTEGSNQGGMDLSGILNMMGPMLSSLNTNSVDNIGDNSKNMISVEEISSTLNIKK